MAQNVIVTDTNSYKVKRREPVQLQVVVGEAQVGGTSLFWEGKPLPFDNKRGIGEIGRAGESLARTILQCMTIVEDKNPATNKTSVTYTLTGGVKKESYPYSVEVKKDKDTAHYLITFLFTT